MRTLSSLLLAFAFCLAISAQEMPLPITIEPSIDYESVANRADLTELLARLPKTDPDLQNEDRFNPNIWATDVRHVRDVWCLQFSCKPVRIIDVDLPNTNGNLDRKKVWYLVYKVKNLGPSELDKTRITQLNSTLGSAIPPGNEKVLPVPTDTTLNDLPRSAPLEFRLQTGIFVPHPGTNEPIRFMPQFILATDRLVLGTEPVNDPATGQTEWKANTTAVVYSDRIIPLALSAIAKREKMESKLETSVSIADKEIAVGQELWGVAMWIDVDPRINEFSIFVGGLTNAYQWLNRRSEFGESENGGQIGEGRIIRRRVLKLDWWRVGDQHSLNDSQIHFGSREAKMPESIFDRSGAMTLEERERLDRAIQEADTSGDGWVSPAERSVYHLMRQDWLQPSFGYEWLFL